MDTKIIAVGNQKGGVGKSSAIYWLASTLSLHYGKKVAVVDGIDAQKTIAKRRAVEVSEGKETFPFEVFFIHHLSELDTVLDEYFGEFDLILLDMPPLVKNEFKILLAGCDGLLIPMLADTVDRDSALDYMLYVNEIKRENEAYLCYGFINWAAFRRFSGSVKQKELPVFAKNHGIELFESAVPAVPLVLSMNETYISPYDKIGSNGKKGKPYLEAFILEFIDKFLK